MSKKFAIKCSLDAFDKDKQRANISGDITLYDANMANAMKSAEVLDRYDDFSALKIKPDFYRQQEEGEYGIALSDVHKSIHSPDVILRHQQSAALTFLKELRGFGLLADVVGSGKTFEAGVILSELAVRGKMKSLLIVVPEQVYDNWVDVIENKFGLGKGVLKQVKDTDFGDYELYGDSDNKLYRPKNPIIVTTENFVKWRANAIRNVLFDVVVVDEAHHLSSEEGEYATAMKLLSILMETKKKANSTYCLLLSATPHSGNLDKMFRLWYFIRCKGGNPGDFEEKDDKDRTEEYRKEKEYYKNNVCRGANTVAEFIAIVKKSEVENVYREQFKEFLIENGEDKTYPAMIDSEKQLVIEEFLAKNKNIRSRVLESVANAYHNGVLRTIMIRQPNELPKSRNIINTYFFPMQAGMSSKLNIDMDRKPIVVDLKNINTDKALNVGGEYYSLKDYVEQVSKFGDKADRFGELLVSKILGATGSFENKNIFEKANSQYYYWYQLSRRSVMDSQNNIVFVDDRGDSFAGKFAELKKILDNYPDERIVIFFDYELPKSSRGYEQWKKVADNLLADSKYASRIIVADNTNKKNALNEFNSRHNAVLISADQSLTEGVNLQESKVIVNFQVTPDPLAMDQRIGRIFRLGQKRDIDIYSFADMNKLEGYALAYFNTIGLMSSNSGDATIIAGSNNDRMVAVRCPACGRVLLYSKEEYNTKKKNNNLYCDSKKQCTQDNPKGTWMEEINVYEFKCSACESTFTRSTDDGGYKCMSHNNSQRGIMCNTGKNNDRDYYCSKICAMMHCRKFKNQMAGKCAVIEAYKQNNTISSAMLSIICNNCPSRYECDAKCRYGTDKESIEGCMRCDYAECSPKPHIISFDNKWNADCPKCHEGKLQLVTARTFVAFLRASWDFKHDGGNAFCHTLLNEAKKVADIKLILSMDKN